MAGINLTISAVDATGAAFRSATSKASSFKMAVGGVGSALKSAALAAMPLLSIAAAVNAVTSASGSMSRALVSRWSAAA